MKHTLFYTFALLAIGFLLFLNYGRFSQESREHETVFTDSAPAPIGPYAQAVRRGNALFVSGQIAIDPATGQPDTSDRAAETRRVLGNIRAILRAEGMDMQDIAQARIYLTNIADYKLVNEVYAGFFGNGPYPARETVGVSALPKGVHVEISVIAIK